MEDTQKKMMIVGIVALAIATLVPVFVFEVDIDVLALQTVIVYGTGPFIWKRRGSGKIEGLKYLIVSFLVCYMVILGGAYLFDEYVSFKMRGFDLDGDTFISSVESTPEYEALMEIHINDLGRNLLFITGALASVFGGVAVLLLVGLQFVYRRLTTKSVPRQK